MSRKHFIAIAEAFAHSKPAPGTPEYRQWEQDVRNVANAVRQFNNAFKFQTFLNACGVE